MTQPAGGGIFVSYRRQETEHVAGRLADRLATRFGKRRVFIDVVTITPGTDFTKAIAAAVSRCDVLLALIGPQWLDIRDEDGRRRLADPDDYLVQEIRAALDRDIPVVPVLVDGARMPRRADLPESLAKLTYRHAVRLDAETFNADSGALLEALAPMVRPPWDRRRLLVIAGAVVATLGVATAAFQLIPDEPGTTNSTTTPSDSTTPTPSPTPTRTPPPTPAELPQSDPIPQTTLIAPRALDGDTDLFLVDTTTGETTAQLTMSTARDAAPIISPDRRAIAYVQDPGGVLRVAAADGSGDRPFFETPPPGCPSVLRPAWNPVDARQLAVTCIDDSDVRTLRVFDVGGTEIRRLDPGVDVVDDLSYSPDGTTIVYWANEAGSQEGAALYSIAADGSAAPVQLTGGDAEDDGDAVWSPDGAHIAFRRCATDSGFTDCDLYVMDADGGNPRVLAAAPGVDQDPTWSPDGASIAFKSDRTAESGPAGNHFWIVATDGTGLRQLPPGDNRVDDSAPAWGPR